MRRADSLSVKRRSSLEIVIHNEQLHLLRLALLSQGYITQLIVGKGDGCCCDYRKGLCKHSGAELPARRSQGETGNNLMFSNCSQITFL